MKKRKAYLAKDLNPSYCADHWNGNGGAGNSSNTNTGSDRRRAATSDFDCHFVNLPELDQAKDSHWTCSDDIQNPLMVLICIKSTVSITPSPSVFFFFFRKGKEDG